MVLDLAPDRDEDRLVLLDRADDVVAGDVGRGDDDDLRPVERRVEVERVEPRVRVGRSDRGPEPGAREDQVVGVLRGAGQLVGAFAPERRRAAGPAGSDRPGCDHDGAGRLGPGRQVGHGPSSMAIDSITGRTASIGRRVARRPVAGVAAVRHDAWGTDPVIHTSRDQTRRDRTTRCWAAPRTGPGHASDSVLLARSRGYSPLAVALSAGAGLIKKRTR